MKKNSLKDKKTNKVALTIVLCFVMIFFGLGAWGPKGLFVAPITSALGISRSAYSLSDTFRYVATAIVNIFFGTLVGKFGSKKLILAGFFALFCSAILYAVAESVVAFYLGGVFLGVGLSWTGTTIVGYVVNKVCKKNKGTLMGFILAANGVGGATATQIVSIFINEKGNPFGYRNAYFLMAGIFVAIFLIILLLYKEPQKSTDQVNDKTSNNRKTDWKGIDYKVATKKIYFYGACICIFFTGLVLQGITSIYAAHMTDIGLDVNYITLVASVSSIALSLFKFINGFMYDKTGLRTTITIDCVAAIGVMASLYFITNTPFGMVLAMVYAVLAAIALPLETVMLPIYANDLFGDKSFNKVLGVFVSVNQAGYALGAPVINLCYDVFGSYNLALIICAVVMIAVVIGLQFVITCANRERQKVIDGAYS